MHVSVCSDYSQIITEMLRGHDDVEFHFLNEEYSDPEELLAAIAEFHQEDMEGQALSLRDRGGDNSGNDGNVTLH